MTTDETARAVAFEEAVRRFGEAWACGDVAVLEPLLSPTYTHTDVAGRFQDRAAWLDYARGLPKLSSADSRQKRALRLLNHSPPPPLTSSRTLGPNPIVR